MRSAAQVALLQYVATDNAGAMADLLTVKDPHLGLDVTIALTKHRDTPKIAS
jgi:hypothetical protein